MTKIINETTLEGYEIVTWTNEDGSGGSMTKEAYDRQQAEQSTQPIGGNK